MAIYYSTGAGISPSRDCRFPDEILHCLLLLPAVPYVEARCHFHLYSAHLMTVQMYRTHLLTKVVDLELTVPIRIRQIASTNPIKGCCIVTAPWPCVVRIGKASHTYKYISNWIRIFISFFGFNLALHFGGRLHEQGNQRHHSRFTPGHQAACDPPHQCFEPPSPQPCRCRREASHRRLRWSSQGSIVDCFVSSKIERIAGKNRRPCAPPMSTVRISALKNSRKTLLLEKPMMITAARVDMTALITDGTLLVRALMARCGAVPVLSTNMCAICAEYSTARPWNTRMEPKQNKK